MSNATPLPQNLINLFHNGHINFVKHDKRLEIIHSNPTVFFIRNFLSLNAIDYLDKKISQLDDKFASNLVVEEGASNVISSLCDTSTSVFLSKNNDEIRRKIESDATGTTA